MAALRTGLLAGSSLTSVIAIGLRQALPKNIGIYVRTYFLIYFLHYIFILIFLFEHLLSLSIAVAVCGRLHVAREAAPWPRYSMAGLLIVAVWCVMVSSTLGVG